MKYGFNRRKNDFPLAISRILAHIGGMIAPESYMPHTGGRAGRIGIIDIGSNSVRLVVYDQLKRSSTPLYNEKVICQLGRGLALTGRLNPEGVGMARAAIARFLAMVKAMEVMELDIVATAAVREASDGEAFVAELEKKHRIQIEIISGRKEARLGAYGICASVHAPEGLSGDLGGGSMELVWLDQNFLKEQVTLPLGVLRLADETGGNREMMRAIAARELGCIDWISASRPEQFYAIGGSFRALAHMHMLASGYPLHILHQYTVEGAQILAYARALLALPEAELAAQPGAAAKRLITLPVAAVILEQMLETARPKQVVFSASGIREGYLYDKLAPFMREEDALLSSCTEFAQKAGRGTAYAHELYAWMKPLFPGESEEDSRLRFAACLLNDVARFIHPEHRAEWAMDRILYSNLTAITHPQRAQLALALYHRYQFRLKSENASLRLVDGRSRAWAKLFGAAANLAYHLTGGIPGTLPETALAPAKNKLSLNVPRHLQDLLGEAVKKRIGGVEEAWVEAQAV